MSPIIKSIFDAYADCHDRGGKRDLNFFCTQALSGHELIDLMPMVVPEGYNAFDAIQSIKPVVEFFGADAKYHIAREGSVCVYIKPAKGNIWLNGRFELPSCDEFSFCCEKQMFRVWWD